MAEKEPQPPVTANAGDDKSDARAKALLAARQADELKARDIIILDVADIAAFTDYFVICTGETKRHVRAIAARVERAAAKHALHVHHAEGVAAARWVLLDLYDVIVHVFDQASRDYYELERLWGDARRVPVSFP